MSGFVLTWQAAFATRINYTWGFAHLVAGYVFSFALLVHTVMLWIRKVNAPDAAAALRRGKRSFLMQCGVATLVLFAIHAGSTAMYEAPTYNNEFPDDYSWKFGKDRPFAPSLVRTVSKWAYDASTMSGSAGCGTSGCHSEIYAEWEPNAHRYSSSDVVFQAVQHLMVEDVGAEATRYCAGCHDPIALLSGTRTSTSRV